MNSQHFMTVAGESNIFYHKRLLGDWWHRARWWRLAFPPPGDKSTVYRAAPSCSSQTVRAVDRHRGCYCFILYVKFSIKIATTPSWLTDNSSTPAWRGAVDRQHYIQRCVADPWQINMAVEHLQIQNAKYNWSSSTHISRRWRRCCNK